MAQGCTDRVGSRQRRSVRNLATHRLLTNIVGIANRLARVSRVDDQINLAVLDRIQHMRLPLLHLVNCRASQSSFADGLLCAIGCDQCEAAINQAPMPRRGGGFFPLDWFANKVDVWRSRDPTPAHLLRDVFEQASGYEEARRLLSETAIAAPAIFSLVGCRGGELSVIERTENATHVHDGARASANAWQAPAWSGRARGAENSARVRQLSALPSGPTEDLQWLTAPVLNDTTRLAAVFTPASGRILAQGFAGVAPATAVLRASLAVNPMAS